MIVRKEGLRRESEIWFSGFLCFQQGREVVQCDVSHEEGY